MFSARHLFTIGLVAFLIQPCLFQAGLQEEDLCQTNAGIGESEFSKTVEGAKIKADAIKLMHASGLMKVMHNGTSYMAYQFQSSYNYQSSVFLLSYYMYYDINFPSLLCAFYGGHLPEITSYNLFTEIVNFLNINSDLECVFLGSVRRTVDGVSSWVHRYSGTSANVIFSRNSNYPTDVKSDSYTRLVRDNTTLASLSPDWFAVNSLPHTKDYFCHLLCQVPK